jgi:hypothetical protein
LKRDKKAEVKEVLRSGVEGVLPEVLLRAYLAANSEPPPNLLQPAVIQRAFGVADILRSAKYLTRALTEIEASGWLKTLAEEAQRGDRLVQYADISRVVQTVSRWFKQMQRREVTLTENSTLELLRLFAALADRVGGHSTASQASRVAATLLAIAIEVTDTRRTVENLQTLLRVVRTVRRVSGNSVVENALGDLISGPRTQALREWIITELPHLLAVGRADAVEEIVADRLFLRINPEVLRERMLRLWKETGREWPLRSREWVSERFGLPMEQEGGVELADEGERLSLKALAQVLLTGWRASQRDPRSRELFDALRHFAEQFEDLYFGGEVGAESKYDPRIHDAPTGLTSDDKVRIEQPWVEHRGAQGTRLLARAQVERA